METQEKIKTITINGTEYIEASAANSTAESVDGMPYVIVRTYSAGVFAGYLKRQTGKEVEMINARRLWYWSGAASLSQLSVDGISNPSNCKFPCEVPSILLTEAIEILSCSKKAKDLIAEVPIWEK